MADMPPPLVWPDGRLMRPEALRREIAAPSVGSVRSVISGHPAQGLDPVRLAQLLRAAEHGNEVAYFELAEEMEEKDLHYLAVLGTRKRAVCQLPIEVDAAGDSPEEQKDADLVRDWIDSGALDLALFDILDAIGKGRSACEIIWKTSATRWLPDKIKWRDPRHFEYDRVSGEELLLRGDGQSKRLPAAKFIVHTHKAKSGVPIRGGLARAVAWGYMFKNFSLKDWAIFLESYGHPLRLGKYGPNESETNKRILANALTQLGADAWGTIPETMKIEFIDRKAGTAPSDLWKAKAEYWDQQVSKAVLGQTNTTDAQAGGLGSGQANVHNDVREDIMDADAKLVSATINRDAVIPIVILNHGARARYPRVRIGRPDEIDAARDIENAERLTRLGVRIGGVQMRERAGLPAPEEGEEPLQMAPPQISPQEALQTPSGGQLPKKAATGFLDPLKSDSDGNGGPDDGAIAASAPERSPDGIDQALEEHLDDWQVLIDPVLGPVDELLEDAVSLEDVRDRLAGALQAMDTGRIHSLVARMSFGARLLGDIEARVRDDD
ncbi:MAG: DUF935 domain-containing protein [Blastomonas sp.]